MKDGAGCDVELARCLIVWHLPATEDEALLWRRDARLLLDFLLDSGDLVVEIDVELNLLACECLWDGGAGEKDRWESRRVALVAHLYFDEHCTETTAVKVVVVVD